MRAGTRGIYASGIQGQDETGAVAIWDFSCLRGEPDSARLAGRRRSPARRLGPYNGLTLDSDERLLPSVLAGDMSDVELAQSICSLRRI
jgi:hypothetical protein